MAYSRRKVQCRKESNIAPLEPRLNKAKKKQNEKVTKKQYFTAALQLVPRCHTPWLNELQSQKTGNQVSPQIYCKQHF